MNLYEITEQKLYYLRYSENTIKTYLGVIYEFEYWCNKHYSRISSKDIQYYLDQYNFKSNSNQNQVISALKFAWEKALGKKYLKINFTRPRKEKKLPKVIDAELLSLKISNVKNLKHKCILALGLSCGLRIGEVINLKWEHLDGKENVLNVINGKGRKDRYCKLNDNMIELLYDYYSEFKDIDKHLCAKQFVFVGQSNKKQYSASSIQNIVKKYIHKKASYHLLRHSHSTFAIDNGTPLPVLQKSLGHSNPNTTSIYLHLSKKSLNQLKQAI